MENNKDGTINVGLSSSTLALRDELAAEQLHLVRRLATADGTLEVRRGHDALWILVRREGAGGFALRAVHSPGAAIRVEATKDDEGQYHFEVNGSLGKFNVILTVLGPKQPLFRCTVQVTPSEDLRIPPGSRDLYLLDADDNPCGTVGTVHAAQRGLTSGLVYLSLAQPRFGSLLYFQNLTALNDYFAATETKPDGCVGGHWPELGLELPATGVHPLPKGKTVVVSDALIHWTQNIPENPRQSARLFLDLLGGVYRRLDRPAPKYHNWPRRAEETLRDIEHAPEATIRHYGNLYMHPYVAAEYPDSMVQLTVLLPIREYQEWTDTPIPLTDQLRKGIKRYFDPELNMIRRYLPNVGSDKDPDAVDSWYMYHPLTNLGRLALQGDDDARDMFLKSLEYGIKVARHFKYNWPVQFKLDTLEIITGVRKEGEPGQSDAGGLYAYVMLQAFELTRKDRYLEEAKTAIQALEKMEFELEYQSNLCAWGACASLRLWQITGEENYREQSEVFLACFFHNTMIWESEIENAQFYPIFLGVTCLHDGPYMALYECFESFCAFHEFLNRGGDEIPDSVRLLVSEYCKYTISRAWYYYPQELPKEALATEIRNGHIDRKLAFPVEDLYAGGDPAGQVGQEIYGCGAAFAFSTRSFHRFPQSPFLLFCDYPVFGIETGDEGRITFQVRGASGFSCRARLIPTGHKTLPAIAVTDENRNTIPSRLTEEGHCEFEVRVGGLIELRWED